MKIEEIQFNQMKGNANINVRERQESEEICKMFIKKLRIRTGSWNIDSAGDIHINNKNKSIDIIERYENKFVVVTEFFNHYDYKYYELV